MGQFAVHEFISLDGVVEDPRWTMDYPFDPEMGQAIAGIMGSSRAMLLGRSYLRDVRAGLVDSQRRRGSGSAVHERDAQVRRLEHAVERRLEQLGDPRSLQPRGHSCLKDRIDGGIYVSGSARLVGRPCSPTAWSMSFHRSSPGGPGRVGSCPRARSARLALPPRGATAARSHVGGCQSSGPGGRTPGWRPLPGAAPAASAPPSSRRRRVRYRSVVFGPGRTRRGWGGGRWVRCMRMPA